LEGVELDAAAYILRAAGYRPTVDCLSSPFYDLKRPLSTDHIGALQSATPLVLQRFDTEVVTNDCSDSLGSDKVSLDTRRSSYQNTVPPNKWRPDYNQYQWLAMPEDIEKITPDKMVGSLDKFEGLSPFGSATSDILDEWLEHGMKHPTLLDSDHALFLLHFSIDQFNALAARYVAITRLADGARNQPRTPSLIKWGKRLFKELGLLNFKLRFYGNALEKFRDLNYSVIVLPMHEPTVDLLCSIMAFTGPQQLLSHDVSSRHETKMDKVCNRYRRIVEPEGVPPLSDGSSSSGDSGLSSIKHIALLDECDDKRSFSRPRKWYELGAKVWTPGGLV